MSDTLRLNVGGVRYMVQPKTLQRQPESRLGKLAATTSIKARLKHCHDYFEEDREYFFDWSPHLFPVILNYYHTGSLHKVESICAQMLKDELEFWQLETNLSCTQCHALSPRSEVPDTQRTTTTWLSAETELLLQPTSKEPMSVLQTSPVIDTDCKLSEINETTDEVFSSQSDKCNNITGNLEGEVGHTATNKVTVHNDDLKDISEDLFSPNASIDDSIIDEVESIRNMIVSFKHASRYDRIRFLVWETLENSTINLIGKVIKFWSVLIILISTVIMILDSMEQFHWSSYIGQTGVMDSNLSLFSPEVPATEQPAEGTVNNIPIDVYLLCRRRGNGRRKAAAHAHETSPDPTLVTTFRLLDLICTIWFTIEFLVRLWATPNRLAFIRQPLSIVDMLSVFPSYVEFVYVDMEGATRFRLSLRSLRAFRALRALRVFRVLKLVRYESKFEVLAMCLKNSMPEIILLGIYLFIATFVFGSLLYYSELDELDSEYTSIPIAAWWSITTYFGYAAEPPLSFPGKIISAIGAVCGLILLALVGILIGNFMHNYKKTKKIGAKATGFSLGLSGAVDSGGGGFSLSRAGSQGNSLHNINSSIADIFAELESNHNRRGSNLSNGEPPQKQSIRRKSSVPKHVYNGQLKHHVVRANKPSLNGLAQRHQESQSHNVTNVKKVSKPTSDIKTIEGTTSENRARKPPPLLRGKTCLSNFPLVQKQTEDRNPWLCPRGQNRLANFKNYRGMQAGQRDRRTLLNELITREEPTTIDSFLHHRSSVQHGPSILAMGQVAGYPLIRDNMKRNSLKAVYDSEIDLPQTLLVEPKPNYK